MGIRESLGGMAEAALNEAVDKALEDGDLYKKAGDMIANQLKKLLGDNLKEKLKANIIDKIDGEDDIPDV